MLFCLLQFIDIFVAMTTGSSKDFTNLMNSLISCCFSVTVHRYIVAMTTGSSKDFTNLMNSLISC